MNIFTQMVYFYAIYTYVQIAPLEIFTIDKTNLNMCILELEVKL